MTSRAAHARNKLGHATRFADPATISDARKALAEAKIHDYIEKVLAAAPPLSDEQCTRLTELLRPIHPRHPRGGAK